MHERADIYCRPTVAERASKVAKTDKVQDKRGFLLPEICGSK